MESQSVLLVLLLCSLSVADLQSNEIIHQTQVSAESVNVSPSDLHTMLMEVVAKLAVLEYKIEQVEKQNDGQAAELNGLKMWTTVTENHVDSLMKDREVGRVAFSASLWTSGSGSVGPVSVHTKLVFRHVISNIGNAYNPGSGTFTAPVRGAYRFEFFVLGVAPIPAHADLMKNDEHVVSTVQHQTGGWGVGGNGVTVVLEAGDVLHVRVQGSYRVHDDGYHYCTFSGFLLFPM